MRPWSADVSRRLDLAQVTVEALEEVEPSPGQEKALAKWQGIKSKLEAVIFDGNDTDDK